MLGEAAAVRLLRREGYEIIERNWRCRSGEIDIVAKQGERLIFVEVRTRSGESRFGTAAESVDYRKQRKLRETALVYVRSAGLQGMAMRFDVVAVLLGPSAGEEDAECRHYPAAF